MGIGWRQQNRCQHPEHKFQTGKKAPKIRSIPLASLVAYNETNSPLPVGAAFCFSHLKSMEVPNERSDFEKTPMKCSNAVDDLYIPEAAIISNESLEESTHVANSLCEALVTSPLTFQIKEKKVADLSDGTKQKVKQKFERIKVQLEKKFCRGHCTWTIE